MKDIDEEFEKTVVNKNEKTLEQEVKFWKDRYRNIKKKHESLLNYIRDL